MCAAGQRRLDEVKRFDMPGFKPRPEWVGEMKRCGILAPEFDPARDPIDVYATEQAYWKSLHYQPPDNRHTMTIRTIAFLTLLAASPRMPSPVGLAHVARRFADLRRDGTPAVGDA